MTRTTRELLDSWTIAQNRLRKEYESMCADHARTGGCALLVNWLFREMRAAERMVAKYSALATQGHEFPPAYEEGPAR